MRPSLDPATDGPLRATTRKPLRHAAARGRGPRGGLVLITDDGGATWDARWTGRGGFIGDLAFLNEATLLLVGEGGALRLSL